MSEIFEFAHYILEIKCAKIKTLVVMWLHRFMKVDDSEHYTLPTLDMLEHNLEAAISKVRSEKERKMGGEINFLENMVLLSRTYTKSLNCLLF